MGVARRARGRRPLVLAAGGDAPGRDDLGRLALAGSGNVLGLGLGGGRRRFGLSLDAAGGVGQALGIDWAILPARVTKPAAPPTEARRHRP